MRYSSKPLWKGSSIEIARIDRRLDLMQISMYFYNNATDTGYEMAITDQMLRWPDTDIKLVLRSLVEQLANQEGFKEDIMNEKRRRELLREAGVAK